MMDHETMMLKCIEQATAQGYKGDEALAVARKMFNQITGRPDERGPDKIETPMATIYREPPFKDYKPE